MALTQENSRLKKEVAELKEESRRVLIDKQQMAREQVSAFFLVSQECAVILFHSFLLLSL